MTPSEDGQIMRDLLNAGQIMYGIQLPDRYNIELLRIEHKDYVANSGALDSMASQGLPNID
jgi:hypothetical protein